MYASRRDKTVSCANRLHIANIPAWGQMHAHAFFNMWFEQL
jgi:hypothetical protein